MFRRRSTIPNNQGTLPCLVRVPDFILRKLYKKGSLHQVSATHFAFTFQNPFGTATLLATPRIVVNGISYRSEQIEGLPGATPDAPFVFRKGTSQQLKLPGQLLRGGNRIHLIAETKEFGTVEVYAEDKDADFCEVPGMDPAPTVGSGPK